MARNKRLFSTKAAAITLVAVVALSFFALATGMDKSVPTALRIDVRLSHCSPSHLPFLVAEDRGLFGKYGLAPIIHSDREDKIALGTFDVVVAGRASVYLSEANSPGRLSVFATNYLDTSNTNYAILVRKDSPYKTLASLAGRAIGVEMASGRARFVLMRIILERNGLDPKDFSVVDSTTGSLRDGSVDALYLREPELSLALAEGKYRILVDEPVANYVMTPWPMSFYALSADFAASNPDAAGRAVSALDEAITIIRNDPAYARGVMQKCMQADYGSSAAPRLLRQWQQGEADLNVIQSQMDLYWQNGLIPSRINATTLVRN